MGEATLALLGGQVLCLDESGRTASAVAIAGNRIVDVGSDREIQRLVGSATTVIDLDGRTAIPGFIDAHAHVELGAYGEHIWRDIRGLSREETCRAIEILTETLPAGTWIVGQGTFGQDFPSRADLTLVAPVNPVVLRWSMHLLVSNDLALEMSGLSRASADPVGSRLQRDERGELSGIVEEGFDLFDIPRADATSLAAALEASLSNNFLAQGVTSVYELPISRDAVRIYQRLQRTGRLPVRLSLTYAVDPGHQPLAQLDHLTDLGIESGFGNDWLSISGIKIFVDGDEQASLWRNQISRPTNQWGVMTRTPQALASLVSAAARAGVQTWMHAIGDLAQEFALDAIEMAVRNGAPADHRTRIEHIANECTDLEQVERIRELGAIPVPTASFLHTSDSELTKRLGPKGGAFIFRSLLDAGLRPPGNADNAGTMPYALNPLFGIQCMVSRRNQHGDLIDESQRIDVLEALRVYTGHSAYAGFQERNRGSISEGLLADIAVLSMSPLDVPPADLLSIHVDHTIIDGEVRFSRATD